MGTWASRELCLQFRVLGFRTLSCRVQGLQHQGLGLVGFRLGLGYLRVQAQVWDTIESRVEGSTMVVHL